MLWEQKGDACSSFSMFRLASFSLCSHRFTCVNSFSRSTHKLSFAEMTNPARLFFQNSGRVLDFSFKTQLESSGKTHHLP
ncbi:hypothetical protein C1H46_034214 [Malus baccata]|uniref:Uncharacterized protein n=1 Tax=Malus baccata TaxID=106549 RepID=A0A540L163_MALBA|nr:hypothetical protein C1H46_034214 [Malus baccata]